jgi:hypothetical protein
VTDWRSQLLALQPGIPTWLNGLPVTRIPCDGAWFRVGIHEDYPCITYQELRLCDAISRVASGYFPRLKTAPGLRKWVEQQREEFRLRRNAELAAEEARLLVPET